MAEWAGDKEAERQIENMLRPASTDMQIVAKEGGIVPLKENITGVHRFVKGQPGGPGRPKASREERVLRLMDAHITDEDLIAVIKSLVQGAIAGHNKKQELLLNHLLGTPVQRTQQVGMSFADVIAMLTNGE